MTGIVRIQKRFDELAAQTAAIKATKKTVTQQMFGTHDYVDSGLVVGWATSVESLLIQVFGPEHPVMTKFFAFGKSTASLVRLPDFNMLEAILLSAKDQYEGGYIFSVRNLVHAEVFSDELEQATHFLERKFKVPAAVVAGTVLESTLRAMCDLHPNLESCEKLNTMNDDLAREGVYNKMRAEQIRAWAKIRNAAAHGHPEEFEDGDVTRMIDGIRDFVANHMC